MTVPKPPHEFLEPVPSEDGEHWMCGCSCNLVRTGYRTVEQGRAAFAEHVKKMRYTDA